MLSLRDIPEGLQMRRCLSRVGQTIQPPMHHPRLALSPRGASYAVPPDAASAFGSRIPAIKAMRTRSERLVACIFIMRLAR